MRYMLVRLDEGSVRLFVRVYAFHRNSVFNGAYIVMFVTLRTMSAGEHFWQMLKHSDLRFSERWVLTITVFWEVTSHNLVSEEPFFILQPESYSLTKVGVTQCRIPQDHSPNNVEYCPSTKKQRKKPVFFVLTTEIKLLSITCFIDKFHRNITESNM
jgi:hypothetical protein